MGYRINTRTDCMNGWLAGWMEALDFLNSAMRRDLDSEYGIPGCMDIWMDEQTAGLEWIGMGR